MTTAGAPPPQRSVQGGRQLLDAQWLAYVTETLRIGDGSAIAADARFREGVARFNEGEFRAAHETWEELWTESAYPQRLFLLAFAKLGAGFAHAERRNPKGIRRLLGDALRLLRPFAPAYAGVDVERLAEDVGSWLGSGLYGPPFPLIAESEGPE